LERLFHAVLDDGLVHDGEHLLGLGFGGREEAGAQTGGGEDGFPDYVIHQLAVWRSDVAVSNIGFVFPGTRVICIGPGKSQLMAYVIAEPCIGTKDTACVDACPVDCIHPKKDEANFAAAEMLYIDPVECIDCGACVPVCPVSAIFALDDLPEKWAEFTPKNAAYYGK
jgi:ferredoxin